MRFRIIVINVKIHEVWPSITSSFWSKHNCKNIFFLSEISLIWAPNFSAVLIYENLFSLFIIITSIKHAFKPHITSQPRKPFRIPKNVNLPSDFRCLHSNLIGQKLMPTHKVINKIIITRNRFIGTWHASINNIKPTLFNQLPDLFLFLVILFLPPHFEKCHLGIIKSSIWIFW